MKRAFAIVLVVLLAVPALMLGRALTLPAVSSDVAPAPRIALGDETAAVERLAREGFRPARTVHLVFGHDEEVGGRRGALAVAERFQAQGARFEWVLDEGGTIGEGLVTGVDAPVALIGIA